MTGEKRTKLSFKTSNTHRLEKCVGCYLLLYNWDLWWFFGWLPTADEFLVSKETVVLRQWERSKQKFGFIKRVDKG